MRLRAARDLGDFTLAIQDFAHAAGGHHARGVVIGGHLSREIRRVDRGIENHDGYIFAMRALDDADHGGFVDGCEADGVDTLGDHGVDDLQLAGEVGFRWRAVPDDVDACFTRGGDGARVDGLPEQVRLTLGDDGDALARVAIAGCQQGYTNKSRAQARMPAPLHFHSGNFSGAVIFCQPSPLSAFRNATRSFLS